MHEVSVMDAALALAAEQARAHGASRILGITLRVGALSGVDPEALRFAFEVVAGGTIAEGAVLTIEDVPVACVCETCGRSFRPDGPELGCPGGPDHRTRIDAGRELLVASLEVE